MFTSFAVGNDHKRSGLSPGIRKLHHGRVGYYLGIIIPPFEAF